MASSVRQGTYEPRRGTGCDCALLDGNLIGLDERWKMTDECADGRKIAMAYEVLIQDVSSEILESFV